MNKKDLSESDICAKCITPAVIQARWDEARQIRREVSFTKGRMIVHGKLVTRGKAKRADYVLYYQHFPIALIEAKTNNHAVGDGMQQALDYAVTLDIPFVFLSNGNGFVFHDRTGLSEEIETMLKFKSLRNTRVFQEGVEEGIQQGRQEDALRGQRKRLLKQLTHKFGPLSAQVFSQVQAIDNTEKLE